VISECATIEESVCADQVLGLVMVSRWKGAMFSVQYCDFV